jgi:hypothetical protein
MQKLEVGLTGTKLIIFKFPKADLVLKKRIKSHFLDGTNIVNNNSKKLSLSSRSGRIKKTNTEE